MVTFVKPAGAGKVLWRCPGCNAEHEVEAGVFDGDAGRPTFMVPVDIAAIAAGQAKDQPGEFEVLDAFCHSTVNAGLISYAPWCSHKLAGQTVPMVAVDD